MVGAGLLLKVIHFDQTFGGIDAEHAASPALALCQAAVAESPRHVGPADPKSFSACARGRTRKREGWFGKSTAALHIAVALLKAGQRVATVDLDSRQKTFTHYIENRRAWAERTRIQLELPTHYCIERAETSSMEANETTEVANFSVRRQRV